VPTNWEALRERVRDAAIALATALPTEDAIDESLDRAFAELTRLWPPRGPGSCLREGSTGVTATAGDRVAMPELSAEQSALLVMGAAAYLELASAPDGGVAQAGQIAAARARRTAFVQLLRYYGSRAPVGE
jgi:hypothetical protein